MDPTLLNVFQQYGCRTCQCPVAAGGVASFWFEEIHVCSYGIDALYVDTHGHEPVVPAGDILVHAGDFSMSGREHQVQAFCEWFSSQPHPHKVR